ncbi:MAG: hypothetical protein RR444_06415, partial [Oscillospiraceae bacterium]
MNKKLPPKYCNLNFNKPVECWDEGIPLGNGLTGCLIWGKGDALRFSLDRGDIWDKTLYPGVLADDFTYETLVGMAKRREVDEIRRKFDDPYNHPLPTKLPTGKIVFHFDNSKTIQSKLDLATAQAEITVVTTDETIVINSYIHTTKKAGFIKINHPLSKFDFEIHNPGFGIRGKDEETKNDAVIDSVNTGSLKLITYDPPTIFDGKLKKWFIQPVSTDFSYGVFLVAKQIDDTTEIVYMIATNKDTDKWQEDAKERISCLLKDGYDKNLDEHKQWWSDFWGKSSITLPNKMFERQWYHTNYLLGSCSRKLAPPMPLQGVWTADNGELPPWKGDYHNDLNTQMSYYHYLKANHIEEGESFIDFLWDLVPQAKNFAKTFFQTDGLCLPVVMTIDGKPLGGWPMYTLVPTNQMWICQAFERHYRFTGDEQFLRKKAYPYLKSSAICTISLMNEGKDGKLYLPVSSSSEIHDDTAQAWLTPNSNYDLSMIRYVIIQLIRLANILENDEEQYWQDILNKLPPLAVNDNHVLKLSPDEDLLESHRHFAHAMAIHPLRLLDYDKAEEKAIIDNTIHNLELLGTGLWVGFSFTWMAEFYAIQGNGNGAAYQLEVFWRNCCSQNGFHLNGDYKKRGVSQFHYRPFTLEANMCAADSLQEMLLQTEDSTINLFPAIPEEWL